MTDSHPSPMTQHPGHFHTWPHHLLGTAVPHPALPTAQSGHLSPKTPASPLLPSTWEHTAQQEKLQHTSALE